MGQTNNHKSNFHFLSLKSGTHRHHQMLGFIPGDALPVLYCNGFQFLLVLGAFSLEFCLQQVKCMLNRIQVRWLTWPLHNIPLLWLKKTLWLLSQYVSGHCPSALWSAVQWVLKHLAEYEQIILPETLHPAAFVSSHMINKYKGTSSIGSHTCPHHDTTTTMLHWWGGMFWIMSSSFPSPYSSLPIIPSLIFVSSDHKMLFQNCKGFCSTQTCAAITGLYYRYYLWFHFLLLVS